MIEKITALFTKPTNTQGENEALVKLATFFYKIDGRVSLAEQEYINELLSVLA